MKRLIFVTLFAMIAVGATAWGQDCGNWTNNDLRGTYAMSGSGTIDPSLLLPGMGIPAGSVSGFYVGAFTLDGRGTGTAGWVSSNLGGSQSTFQMVAIKYSMQPDCSVQMSLTWKIKELGVTFTVQRVGVVVPKPGGLELHMSLVGASFGKPPGPGPDLAIAYRISMN
jgi:hypothetical protein